MPLSTAQREPGVPSAAPVTVPFRPQLGLQGHEQVWNPLPVHFSFLPLSMAPGQESTQRSFPQMPLQAYQNDDPLSIVWHDREVGPDRLAGCNRLII